MSFKPCCATGSLHTGTPTGRIDKLHGLDCYIADAPNGPAKGVVVIIPDAFGWTFPNNRILADTYAKEGNLTVYLPEFMDGATLPFEILDSMKAMSAPGFSFTKLGHIVFAMRHFLPFLFWVRPSVTGPRVFKFLKDLKQNETKDLPVATAGFCWGGKFVTEFCWDGEENRLKDGTRVTVCGFVAHPSFLKFPDHIDKVQLPYAVAAAENDPQMSPEQAKQTEETLKSKTEKGKANGISHEFVMYPGAHHGFAVRADEDDTEEAERGRKADAQALKWFEKWFANPPP